MSRNTELHTDLVDLLTRASQTHDTLRAGECSPATEVTTKDLALALQFDLKKAIVIANELVGMARAEEREYKADLKAASKDGKIG